MGDTPEIEKRSVPMGNVEEVKKKSKGKENRYGKRYGLELKLRNKIFDQEDFRSERATSFGPFRVIEVGPEGQKKVLMEESEQDPLVAKDMGFVCSLFMPGTSGHLVACLLGKGVIHDEKEDRMGFDQQMVKELGQSDLRDPQRGGVAEESRCR